MNILITSIIDLEKTSYSRLHRFIEHLLDKGHKITVISIKDNWKHKGKKQNQELIKKIKIYYLDETGAGATKQEILSAFKINKILALIGEVDVHFCYNSLILGLFVIDIMKRRGVPTVYDLADDLPDMIRTSPQIPKLLRSLAGFVGKIVLNLNLKYSNHITITAKEFIKGFGLDKYQYSLIPNGADFSSFDIEKKEGPLTIGYLGALREWVDLRPMLLGAKSVRRYFPNLRVLVVGGESDLDAYKTFVREEGMDDFVTFTGDVSFDQVPESISKMDICTIPFKKNKVTDGTCPLKLIEYFAAKKPVISSRLNEVQNMLGSFVRFADTSEEWEREIHLLALDREGRETLAEEGHNYVKKHYAWAHLCQKLEEVLNSVNQKDYRDRD